MTNFYICTHRDFQVPEGLKGNYRIITDGKDLNDEYPYPIIKSDNKLLPMKHAYSEGVMLYDIWKNDTDSDYIGLNHYRRYFDFQFLSEVNENVLPIPYAFNYYTQYAQCHNIYDLDKCFDIIEKYYPKYAKGDTIGLYPCNMFLLDRDTFNRYAEFIFGVLEIFNDQNKLYTDKDVYEYVARNFKDKVEYQSRLHGFLLERLSTIFFKNEFKNKTTKLSRIIMMS